MQLLCLIDSLGSGGAQRQLSFLASELKRVGLGVEVLVYHADDFFLPVLREAGISVDVFEPMGPFRRAHLLRHCIRSKRFDLLLAFMSAPSFYAELSALPARKWKLIVSERLAFATRRWSWGRVRRTMHCIADLVTTNSHTNRLFIEAEIPRLQNRVVTIYNAVDLKQFIPAKMADASDRDRRVRFVVVASHQRKKNLLGLVEAFAFAKPWLSRDDFVVDWFGGFPVQKNGSPDTSVLDEALCLITRRQLQDNFCFHEPTRDLVQHLQRADALILPSFFEGLPNVVCEAMACGKPILMSDVCDSGNLVIEGENGFLFNPWDHRDICRALLSFVALPAEEMARLGRNSRLRAEVLFDPKKFVANYVRAFEAVLTNGVVEAGDWYNVVPSSAFQTVQSKKR